MSTERRHRNARVRRAKLSSVLSPLSWDQLGPPTLRETEKGSGEGQRGDFPGVRRRAPVTSALIALMELSGRQSAGPRRCLGRGGPPRRATVGEGLR